MNAQPQAPEEHMTGHTPGTPAFASLEAIEDSLTFYGGLVATDRPDLFGMDTDARKDVCFEIDTQNELAMVREAIDVRGKLLGALLALFGRKPEDEMVGWRGANLEHPDDYKCEFCSAEHADYSLIKHKPDCPVLLARAAISLAEAKK